MLIDRYRGKRLTLYVEEIDVFKIHDVMTKTITVHDNEDDDEDDEYSHNWNTIKHRYK